MKTKSYNLTDEEADLIIRQLEELPHKTSDKLIINMRSQYQDQLPVVEPPKKANKK